MKIAFVDFIDFDYSIETVKTAPLGGSQSALCYLAESLVSLGHDVIVLNNTSIPKTSGGVICWPLDSVGGNTWQKFDFVIVLSFTGYGKEIKKLSNNNTSLILWIHCDQNQLATQALQDQEEQLAYDHFFFVSHWQSQQFIEKFNIDINKISITKNAIGKPFNRLFDKEKPVTSHKNNPITIAYTSTPFRGLELMLDIFPKIKEQHPDTIFKSFSSNKVYQSQESEEQEEFGELYEKLSKIKDIKCIGSLTQSNLAEEMKTISILAYPNIFLETSCISVMEAMASGCHVITSNLGALPETTAGFATLVPFEAPFDQNLEAYKQDFAQTTIDYISYLKTANVNEVEEKLRKQVDYCQENYTWEGRAQEWSTKLYQLKGYKYFQEADYISACNCYQEAIAVDIPNLQYYLYLTLCFILLDEPESAMSVMLIFLGNNLCNTDNERQALDDIIFDELEILDNCGRKEDADKIRLFFQNLND
jgi:glycosyltransferase involved in cell wall biosynthesis